MKKTVKKTAAQKAKADSKEKEKDMPPRFRETYRRAMSGGSRVAAIKSFCLECVGWLPHEVECCTCPTCPLYPYRPYRHEP